MDFFNKECLGESLLEEKLPGTIQFSFLFISWSMMLRKMLRKKVASWRLLLECTILIITLQYVHKFKYTNAFGPQPRDTGTQPVRSDELWWRKRLSGFRDTTRFQTTWKVTAMGKPRLSELTSSSFRRRGLSGAPQASSLPPHPAPGCHPSAQTATMRRASSESPALTAPCTHTPQP